MSKIALTGNASGTGTLTIAAPNTNSDRTINIPDTAGDIILSEGAVTLNESGADVDFRVESDGNTAALFVDGGNNQVICGANTPVGRFGANLEVTAHGGSHRGGIMNSNFQASANDAVLEFNKSRNDTLNSHTIVQDDDNIGSLIFRGSDGSSFQDAAAISCQVDGTPGSSDMPGRLVFYTTPDGSTAGSEALRIHQNQTITVRSSSTMNAVFSVNGAGTTQNGILSKVANNAYWNFHGLNPSGTRTFSVEGDGDVLNTNGSYGSISDEKLKENIVDANSQWDDIKAIKVKNFSLKDDKLDKPNKIGVIAQDLETSGMNGLVKDNPDFDENMKEKGTVTKSVKYSILYMKAVKALQEAMTRIETLETKVAALEAK